VKPKKQNKVVRARRGHAKRFGLPSYSEAKLGRQTTAALRDVAARGLVKIHRRGRIVAFLVKPSVYRALTGPVRPPGYFASAYKKGARRHGQH